MRHWGTLIEGPGMFTQDPRKWSSTLLRVIVVKDSSMHKQAININSYK